MKDEVPNMGCEMGVPNMGCKMMILKKGPVKWGLKWGLWSEIKLYSWGGNVKIVTFVQQHVVILKETRK